MPSTLSSGKKSDAEKIRKIFIDGSHGTTGLKLLQYLKEVSGISVIKIPYSKRRNIRERNVAYTKVDLVVLCLPDEESEKAVGNIEKLWKNRGEEHPKILDTSTRFRTDRNWVYGHPQLWPEKISHASRVANPGCYAIGFITMVYPLIKEKLIQSNRTLTLFGVSGYSGGGKEMIKDYKVSIKNLPPPSLPYGLGLNHKHLQEMQLITRLKKPPLFLPMVGSYYQGMVVMLPLPQSLFRKSAIPLYKKENLGWFLKKFYRDFYKNDKTISVRLLKEVELYKDKFLSPVVKGDGLEIIISTREDGDSVLFARFDNLGKGASGNALENIRLMLGMD